MSRISNIRIKNFKTFDDLEVKSLNKRINFVYGENGVGKTSLLEAIYLLLCYSEPDVRVLSANFQMVLHYQSYLNPLLGTTLLKFDDLWNTIFKNLNMDMILSFDLEGKDKLSLLIFRDFNKDYSSREVVFKWEYIDKKSKEPQMQQHSIIDNSNMMNRNPFLSFDVLPSQTTINKKLSFYYIPSMFMFNSTHINAIYSEVVMSNKKKELIDILKIVEDDIEDIDLISTGLQTVIVKRKNVSVPINQMGEGFLKIFYIIGVSITRMDGIILIDEIENGLHWSIQKKIFGYILRLSKDLNIQYFIATHSLEFVQEAFKAMKDNDIDSIGATRINKKYDGKIYPTLISGQDLKEMVEGDMEFR
ncbi:ATP/GTP-binding protein [Thermodesulfobium sp. 4217-1]|uniref:AAA family ATPase n=1 Tax=Thermodesulfobium sp. 4217-1 TaxID=3120013 RepID=UPI0032215841